MPDTRGAGDGFGQVPGPGRDDARLHPDDVIVTAEQFAQRPVRERIDPRRRGAITRGESGPAGRDRDDLRGDVLELPVLLLRLLDEELERLVRRAAHRRHDDPLRLLDDRA